MTVAENFLGRDSKLKQFAKLAWFVHAPQTIATILRETGKNLKWEFGMRSVP